MAFLIFKISKIKKILLIGSCFLFVSCTKAPPESRVYCPSLTLIGDLSKTTLSLPKDKVLVAIVASALQCSDDLSAPLTVSLRVRARKHLISSEKEGIQFPFFVAILGPHQKILAKEILHASLLFEKGQSQLNQIITEKLSFSGESFKNATFVVGLQISDQEPQENPSPPTSQKKRPRIHK